MEAAAPCKNPHLSRSSSRRFQVMWRMPHHATIIIPVSTSRATSAVTGSGSLSIGGATVSFSNAIWMGFARNIHGSSSSTTADGEADGFAFSQRTFVHELWHLFGAGYHQNAHKCLSPGSDQTDVLACPSYEYGDKYEILGGSNGWASNTNARGSAIILAGLARPTSLLLRYAARTRSRRSTTRRPPA